MLESTRWAFLLVAAAAAMGCSGDEGAKPNNSGGNSAGGAGPGGSGGIGGSSSGSGVAGSPPSEMCAAGTCDAASCASFSCFDENRCAVDQSTLWGGPMHDHAQAVAVTAAGERVVVGGVMLGPDNDSDWDLFVTKFGADGSEIWSRQIGTALRDYGQAVAVDAAGFIYLAGASEGRFEGGVATSLGVRDVVVTKLGADGSTVWSAQFGSAGSDTAHDIALAADGSVVVAGQWNYDAGAGKAFMARVGADGVPGGVTELAVPYGEAASVDLDAQGNVLVTGETRTEAAGTQHPFAKKLSPDGAEIWSREWASNGADWTNGAVLDASGRLYVTGTTRGALEGNPEPPNGNWYLFLSLVDVNGELLWTRTYFPGVDTRGGNVTLAPNGDVVLVGTVLGELMLEMEGETVGSDVLLMRLCPEGWPKTTQRWDFGSDEWTWTTAVSGTGEVVLSGYTYRTVADGAAYDSTDSYLVTVRPE